MACEVTIAGGPLLASPHPRLPTFPPSHLLTSHPLPLLEEEAVREGGGFIERLASYGAASCLLDVFVKLVNGEIRRDGRRDSDLLVARLIAAIITPPTLKHCSDFAP